MKEKEFIEEIDYSKVNDKKVKVGTIWINNKNGEIEFGEYYGEYEMLYKALKQIILDYTNEPLKATNLQSELTDNYEFCCRIDYSEDISDYKVIFFDSSGLIPEEITYYIQPSNLLFIATLIDIIYRIPKLEQERNVKACILSERAEALRLGKIKERKNG